MLLTFVSDCYRLYTSTINPDVQNSSIAAGQQTQSRHRLSNNVIMGQPTPWTHPHLLKQHEIATGITVDEFKARRERLMNRIQNYSRSVKNELHNHVVRISSAVCDLV